MAVQDIITDHIDIWTSAIKTKSSAERGSTKKLDLYGIKKLRELILELAVRGKLVPQDPNDEPASELLNEIAVEKAQLVKEKKIKKPKVLGEIEISDYPFSLPVGWEFARLNDWGEWGAGSTPSRSNSEYYGGNIPWFKSGELNAEYISESEEYITELAVQKSSVRYNNIGDVLVAMYGATIGKCSILASRATTNQAVCACTPFSKIFNRYLLLVLKGYKSRLIGMGAGGAQPNISREKIIATIAPVPPLKEQHCIVAKVDELMALCDQLESQTDASIDAHKTLVEVLLATLTLAKDADELNDSWQRISQHFDVLFTTEASIDQLKQTILQLAVIGKLVKQDPNDEPATKLLERIAAEKAQLIKDKKIKKHPKVDLIGPSITLPESWVEIAIQDFADIKLGSTPSRAEVSYWDGAIPWVSSGEVVNSVIMDTKEKITELGFANSSAPIIPARSLLMAIIGQGKTRGQSALLGIDATTNQNVAAFVFNEAHVVPEFVWIWAKSKYEAHRGDGRGGAQPALNGKIVRSFKFSLPPYNEQRLIVGKVNELITLCDSLKASLKDAQNTQLHLADAIVEEAL